MTEITGSTSDGYHTFDELYEHRHTLFIALCRALTASHYIWRSRHHSDGSQFKGWFVMGIDVAEGKQITYHLPDRLWDSTSFVEALWRAPPFDGHTSDDVLKRLRDL